MKRILIAFSCLVAGISFGQNRPHYSLYMLRQNIVNPGAVGSQDALSVAVVGNTQINGFAGSPKTLGVDLIAPIGKSGFVIGANAGQDKIGVAARTNFGATVGYRLKLATDHYLSVGVNGMGVQYTASYGDLIVNDGTDPIYVENNFSTMSYDIALGLYYFTNNFYAGVSTMNLTDLYRLSATDLNPTTRISLSNMHIVGQLGYQHRMGENWKLMPSLMYKAISGSPDQFDVNLQFNYKDIIGFGPLYRTSNSFAFQVNTTFYKSFTLGYSYNMGTGFKNHTNFAGHEIMLIYKAKKTKQRLPVDVPRF